VGVVFYFHNSEEREKAGRTARATPWVLATDAVARPDRAPGVRHDTIALAPGRMELG